MYDIISKKNLEKLLISFIFGIEGAWITDSIPGFFAGWIIGLFIMYIKWERMSIPKILLVGGILFVLCGIFGVWFDIWQRVGAGLFGVVLILMAIDLEFR